MNAPPFDALRFKNATREQWDRHAQGWNNETEKVRAWLRPSTNAMIEMANIRPGMHVLDVAAGAGDQTIDVARRVGPSGHVLATDMSPEILSFAKENALRAGLANVEIYAVDGEVLDADEASFDAAICRLGLMFFPDPAKGLRAILRALKPGGRVCTMVFSSPDKNPCITILMSTALKHAGLPPQHPFRPGSLLSLGKPGLIDRLFTDAGSSRVATTKVAAPFRLPSVEDYLAFVRASASPILQIMGRLDDRARAAAWAEMKEKLAVFASPSCWEGPNELLLTVGQR